VTIKNGHSRDACNIGNKTENKDKTNQTKNKPKKTDEQHVPPQNTGGKPNCIGDFRGRISVVFCGRTLVSSTNKSKHRGI
jgi:hypothetical protein